MYDEDKLEEIIGKICDSEILLRDKEKNCTLVNSNFRHRKYRDEKSRKKLNNIILDELYNKELLKDDDKIKLGEGGSKPIIDLQSTKDAYILLGLPASGKSTFAHKLSELTGAYIIDSDFAKRKFPEFTDTCGASLVHEESNEIIDNLLKECLKNGNNFIYPKIGSEFEKIRAVAQVFRDKGYNIHIVLVSLDRKIATLRALNRFIKTDRYVPLSLIFDGYADGTIVTYFRLKENNGDNLFSTFSEISTDVEYGEQPIIINSNNELVNVLKGGVLS